MTAAQHTTSPSTSIISRLATDTRLPYVFLILLSVFFVIANPFNDHIKVFFPAGEAILRNENPYLISTGYFLYWPFSFWFFPLMALHPLEFYLLYILSVVLLIRITQRLEISPWWCLYPPALFTIIYGQIDILILFLMIEAYRRRQSPFAILLVALAASVKPQTTIFWVLPWLWTLPTWRIRVQYSLGVGAIILVPMGVAYLLSPQLITTLWQDWLRLTRETSNVYVDNSMSLWSMGLIVPSLIFLALSVLFSWHQQVSRAMMALGMPAMGFYTGVVMVGSLPTWGLLVAYLPFVLNILLHHNFFWLEPLFIVGYYLWLWWKSRAAPAKV